MSAAEIAELNDHLRQTFTGGRVLMTAQVAALDSSGRAEVLERVRTFTDFNAGKRLLELGRRHRHHGCTWRYRGCDRSPSPRARLRHHPSEQSGCAKRNPAGPAFGSSTLQSVAIIGRPGGSSCQRAGARSAGIRSPDR
jgi:hypothetical protein